MSIFTCSELHRKQVCRQLRGRGGEGGREGGRGGEGGREGRGGGEGGRGVEGRGGEGGGGEGGGGEGRGGEGRGGEGRGGEGRGGEGRGQRKREWKGWGGGVSCKNKTGISQKYLGDLNCKLLLFCNLVNNDNWGCCLLE